MDECGCKACREMRERTVERERAEILMMLDSSIERRLVYGVQLGQDPNENPGLRKAISLIKARGLKAWDPIEERMDTGSNAFTPQGAQEMAWLINRLIDSVNELRARK